MKRRVTLYLEEETLKKMDILRAADLSSRSALVGALVEEEWARFRAVVWEVWRAEEVMDAGE